MIETGKLNPGIFWYWNADPTPGGIRRQLESIKAAGFASVYLHPMPDSFRRENFFQGMKMRYLGRKYFALARVMLTECKRLGLAMMLYDEGGWPSGSVLNRLTAEHPECRAVYLIKDSNGFRKEIENFPDLLKADTTRVFLRMTHELYRKELGSAFGTTIAGIFTDEPFWGCAVGESKVRFTDEMPELCEKLWHCSFEKEILPYLFAGNGDSPRGQEARRKYLEICSRLFAENYCAVLAAWCQKNGLQCEGHFNGEDDSLHHMKNGNMLEHMAPLHVPGVDAILRQIYPGEAGGSFARLAFSSAVRNNRWEALCECFNVYGYFLTAPVMAWVANSLMLNGINRLIPMPYLYDDRGMRKICCSSDVSPRSPAWNAMPALTAFWQWAGNFNPGALEPKVWLLAAPEYPAPDNAPGEIPERNRAAAVAMQKTIDALDNVGVFWRFTDARELESGKRPELLIAPFRFDSGELSELLDKLRADGTRISSGKEPDLLRRFAQVDILRGNCCRLLPCLRPEGEALMVFNPGIRSVIFQFRSEVEWRELPPPDPVISELYPVADEAGIVSLPMPPQSLRILLKGKRPARAERLGKSERLALNWQIAYVERIHYSLQGRTKYIHENVRRSLPASGLYTDLDKNFSGRLVLSSTLRSDCDCKGILEFGEMFHAAALHVNGVRAGLRAFAPWAFKVSLKRGTNRLKLIVSGSGGNEWRRCFREELKPAGGFNTYSEKIMQFTIDDAACGISGDTSFRKYVAAEPVLSQRVGEKTNNGQSTTLEEEK